jgi:hypothetical protein
MLLLRAAFGRLLAPTVDPEAEGVLYVEEGQGSALDPLGPYTNGPEG